MTALRNVAIFTFLAGLALLGLGLVAAYNGDDDEPAAPEEFDAIALATATPTPRDTPTSQPDPTATQVPPSPTPTPFAGEVSSFRLDAFDIDADIENIGLTPNNQLDVPAGADNVGWYGIYDRPGWGGNAVFAAHVSVYAHGPGPFWDLSRTEQGDRFVVTMEDGTEYTYEAIRLKRYHVDEIAMGELIDADEKPDGEEWITLITCGGERVQRADGRVDFLHRDVVVARMIDSGPATGGTPGATATP